MQQHMSFTIGLCFMPKMESAIMTNSPLEKLLPKLQGVKKIGDGYMAICPGHDDVNPSLSISEGRDGRTLVHCHAGCKHSNILKALGLKTYDLYPNDKPTIEKIYPYEDAEGQEIYQIVRLAPKGFFVRHREGNRFINNLNGVVLSPYRLDQLNRALAKGRLVLIVEGEKDVDNVIEQLRMTATTFTFGMRWQDQYADYFEGAKVVIIPDNDKPGNDKAEIVANKLTGVAKSIRMLTLPDLSDKGDISDWIEQGGTKSELLDLIKATPIWKPEAGSDDSDIDRAIKAKFAELNDKYATVMVKGKYYVIEPDYYDPSLKCSIIEFISTPALEKKYAHDKLVIGYRGEIPVERNCVSLWLESPDRRNYNGMVFDPGQDHGSDYFNIWRGFAFQPRKSRIDFYLNHIFEVIASGDVNVYDHIIALMADAVQLRPRPGVALAILGGQGVGKGVAINNFGRLFGRHYLQVTQGSHLTGRFNRHLAEAMIVFIDEAFWAGNKQAEGVLKAMVTEDTVNIEPKGCDVYRVKNHIRILMASNNDWIVPAGMDERRFFVVRASDKHVQDTPYFSRIQKQMDNGGSEGLLNYLQQYDLDGVDLKNFPKTEELANQKLLTMDAFQRFWYSILQDAVLFNEGGLFDDASKITKRPWKDGRVETDLFYRAFQQHLKSEPQRWYGGVEGFGLAIKKMVPNRMKKKVNGVWCYIFPSVQECREKFDQLTKQKWKWQKVERSKVVRI
jgi:hypothetical protein